MSRGDTCERASLSGLFACSVMGLVSLAALAFDGGRIIDTYAEMSALAASTARVGGQELEGIRQSSVRVDEGRARSAMLRFLQGSGYEASIDVVSSGIRVTLAREVPTLWLSAFGIGSRSVTVSRSVEIVRG